MEATPAADQRADTWQLVGIGLAAGVMSGIFGVGGGILMVPAMVVLLRFGQHRAHATSLAAVVPIAAVSAFVFGRADSVNLVAAALLTAGSLLGVQAGAHLMNRLSGQRLAVAFGAFLILIALLMFFL